MKRFENEKFDIIILAGQSNAEGYGVGEATEEYLPDERILWLNDNANPRFENENGRDIFKINEKSQLAITVADEPFNGTSKVGKLSLWFARCYLAERLATGRKLLILNAGVAGTGFRDNQWGVGRTLYQRLKKFTRAALSLNKENRLVAFLWHQGESDSFENATWSIEKRYTTHKRNLSEMVNDFKREFSCPDLPFIAGGFCDEWYLQNKAPCDAVLQAIREVCADHGAFVVASGLLSNNQQTNNGDEIHFCREAAHLLGKKYYEAYKTI